MTSLTDIYNTLLTGVQGINSLSQTLAKVLPTITASSTAIPASPGPLTFSSSQPEGFLLVQTSSGGTYKVPIYSNP
jgi:hypothetical protein